jgi:hypothetical protein
MSEFAIIARQVASNRHGRMVCQRPEALRRVAVVDAVVLGQIIDGRRPAPAIQICGRSAYHTHVGCELTCDHAGIRKRTEADGEIVSSFDKVHQVVGRLEVNP